MPGRGGFIPGYRAIGNFWQPFRKHGPFRALPSTAFLGGFEFASGKWTSPNSIIVQFDTTYTDRHHQLYAGRTLIGVTENVEDTVIEAQLQPAHYPEFFQLVAVLPAEQYTDYGDTLPDRPYNRVRLTWETFGSTDTKYLEVSSGEDAGDAADPENVLDRIQWDIDRKYVWTSKPLEGSGDWNFEVAAIDNKPNSGNRGTALAIQAADVLACPPDLETFIEPEEDGSGNQPLTRLKYTIADGDLTISFILPRW